MHVKDQGRSLRKQQEYPPDGADRSEPGGFYFQLRIVRAVFMVLLRAASHGVIPLLPLECTSAPLETSSLATETRSQLTERRRGVSPRLSRASRFAPQSNNAWATSTLPRRAAMCSAVQCFTPSWASTFAPA